MTAAILGLGGAVTASAIGLAGQLATTDDQPSQSCAAVVAEYRHVVQEDKRLVQLLTAPDENGTTRLDRDPDAQRCGINKEFLRVLADQTAAQTGAR